MTGNGDQSAAEAAIETVEGDAQDFGASLLIGCLLLVPVVIIIVATIFLRLRKKGKKSPTSCQRELWVNMGKKLANLIKEDFQLWGIM